jgi:hypothetical protein
VAVASWTLGTIGLDGAVATTLLAFAYVHVSPKLHTDLILLASSVTLDPTPTSRFEVDTLDALFVAVIKVDDDQIQFDDLAPANETN